MFQNHFLIFETLQVLLESKKSKPNIAFRDWPFQNPARVARRPPPASPAPEDLPSPRPVLPPACLAPALFALRSLSLVRRVSRRVRRRPSPCPLVARRPPRRAVPTTRFASERRGDATIGRSRCSACVLVRASAERASRLSSSCVVVVVSRRPAGGRGRGARQPGRSKIIGEDCVVSLVTS